jgi:hypothetical protein
MDRELQDLRRELGRIERGRGVWYPDPLRVRIAAWARRRRADGATLRELSRETGVCAESLRRWTAGANVVPAMVPIEVVTDQIDEQPRGLRMITASGHRIEGLTIADTITLVRVLG